MDPITISFGGVVAIVASVITLTLGCIAIAKVLKKPPTPKDFTQEIQKLEEEMVKLDKTLTELKSTLDGKIETQILGIETQIEDIKESLRKLTDMVIQIISRGEK